jgi:hypothetical protein
MFFPEDEKDERLSSLEKLKDLMMKEAGDKMGGGGKFKKPIAASMTIEKIPEGDSDDLKDKLEDSMGKGDDDEGMMGPDSDGDVSDEDKDKIRELYHKFCV